MTQHPGRARYFWPLFFSFVLFFALTMGYGDYLLTYTGTRGFFRSYGFFVVAAATVALGQTYFLSRYFSYRFERQLDALTGAANQVISGDLKTGVDVPEDEDFATLAGTMNELIKSLNKRVDDLSKEIQEKSAILSAMTDSVLVVDRDEHIVTVNRAAAQLFCLPEQDMKKYQLREVVRNSHLNIALEEVFRTGIKKEADIVLKGEAEDIWLHTVITALSGPKKKISGALIVFHNISRERKLEQMRKEFVANVSHELRTPITLIKGFIETLTEDDVAAETRGRFLDIMKSHADRLEHIIEDLLRLSSIEQEYEYSTIQFARTFLLPVAERALDLCREKAFSHKINLKLTATADPILPLNDTLMELALVNLLDNAIKYSPENSSVEVTVAEQAGQVMLSVIDQGCGIAAEHLPRIFERFYRVDKARSRSSGGTGLGLSIVKHIVQIHKGQMTVDSHLGKGTTFTITF